MMRFKDERKRSLIDLCAILFASSLVTLPILLWGVPRGNDLPQHYQFAAAIRDSIDSGVIFPSWSPNANAGFGDVGLRFYPPLSYYVLDTFTAIFGSWFYGSVATFFLLFFFGGLGIYLWSRESFGRAGSLAAAIAYIFIPYHVNEIYNAFTFAEFAAAAELPFCFLFLTRVCRRGTVLDCLGLAVSYGALILLHLPLAIVGSVALLVYGLISIEREKGLKTLIRLGGSVALGLVASSFYWVRIVSELPNLKHEGAQFLTQDYDFHNNFVLSFLYVSPEQYAERSLAFLDIMLLVTLAMSVPFFVMWLLRSRTASNKTLFSAIAIFGLGLFFATPLSLPIWERIDILQKIQFPWRWLAITSIAGPIFVAAGYDELIKIVSTRLRPLAIASAGLFIAGVVFTFAQVIRPALYIEPKSFDVMVTGFKTSESCECWWPVWAKRGALSQPQKVMADGRNVAINYWRPTDRSFVIETGPATTARIATFFYPNWQVEVNGSPSTVSYDENGALTVPLPEERAEVRIRFVETMMSAIARNLSILSWLLIALGVVYFKFFSVSKRLG